MNATKNITNYLYSTRTRAIFVASTLVASAVLTACALPSAPPRAVVYDFGPGALAAQPSNRMAPLPTLALAEVEASAALDSTAVLYRLAYTDALVLRPLREQLGLKRARIAFTGGSAVAPDIFRLFAAMGVMLRNVYGCSEFGLITVHQGAQVNAETIGQLVTLPSAWAPGMQWRLGEGGGLEVRGGAGFSGYWGKPEKSAEKMNGDWFQTGDAVGQGPQETELIYYDRVEHMSSLKGGHLFSKQFIEVRLRFSPYIREVMVVGDPTRERVSALVNIDGEVFGRWAERNGVSFTTFTDLSQRPEVLAQVAREIALVNRTLPPEARLTHFVNLPKELDADEGELTRTRKLKRDFIEQRYGVLIEAMYADQPGASIEIPVRYQDGRAGVLRADVTTGRVPQLTHNEGLKP